MLISAILLLGTLGMVTACSKPDNPDKGAKVNKIQASLLDGKIANFMGANGVWQSVEKDIVVDFTFAEKFVGYQYDIDHASIDEFLLTKISNGYAYYSNAAHTDSGGLFESAVMHGGMSACEDFGEYVGVVKIPVDGPVKSNGNGYDHLDFIIRAIYENKLDTTSGLSAFLVGETQMLWGLKKGNTGALYFTDVETGETKTISSSTRLVDYRKDCIKFDGLGWVSLSEKVNYEDFDETYFTEEMQSKVGQLEAYFKFITDKTK